MRPSNYWCIVASKDHVKRGLKEGIAQACHGKAAPLRRMKAGDFVIFYSGKIYYAKPEKCQEFTAIGIVADDEIYSYQMTPEFCPFRRKVNFLKSQSISIFPLIIDLQFIHNKKSWGFPFRFGFFEINQHDFELISSQMLITNND